jgi:hypothetical protein
MPKEKDELSKAEPAPIATTIVSRFPIESAYISHTFPQLITSERVVYLPLPLAAAPEKSDFAEPATVIAAIALLVSIGVPFYTWWKDRGDKKRSIEDDYWLRQVVGPIAIEPLLKNVIAMIGSTPEDASSPGFLLSHVNTYKQQNLTMLATLAVNSNSLQIINEKLADKASSTIDDIQDLMIDYCFANEMMNNSGNVISGYERNIYQDAVRKKLVDLAAVIRTYQEKKTVK